MLAGGGSGTAACQLRLIIWKMIPGTGLGWRLQTGSLNSRSFLKSSYHLEIPTEVFLMEYDIWDLLQNNSGHDGKWVERYMVHGGLLYDFLFVPMCLERSKIRSLTFLLSNCARVNLAGLKLVFLERPLTGIWEPGW